MIPKTQSWEPRVLGVLETEYQKIVDNLRQAREAAQNVETQIINVQQTIDSFSNRVAALNLTVAGIMTKQEELNQAGYKTTYLLDLINQGRSTLDQAQKLASQKRYKEGLKNLDLAYDQIKQAGLETDEMPQRQTQAEAAIPALAARIEQVESTVNQGRANF